MPMDTGSQNQPSVDEGWEEVATTVTRVVFDTIGDTFTGTYIGSEELQGNDGPFTQYLFRGDDGELYGVFSSYSIKKGMSQIPEGHMVRISYTNDMDVNRPSPMRVFKVQHKSV